MNLPRSKQHPRWPTVTTGFVVLVLGICPVACGKESDVLSHKKGTDGSGATSGTDGGTGKAGSASSKGGRSGGSAGSGNGNGNDVDSGVSPGVGQGGASNGDDPNGSAGVPSGLAGAAGSASSGDPLDPHAVERQQVTAALCSVLSTYPCLSYFPQRSGGPGKLSIADEMALCVQDTQVAEYTTFQNDCFDEWAAEARCLQALPRQCPCTGNDCIFYLPGTTPSACPKEELVLESCLRAVAVDDTTGSVRQCHAGKDANGACFVYCDQTDANVGSFSAVCDGPPDGPQACYCELNGIPLHDGTSDDPMNGDSFYADDCTGIAQKVSDGQCDKILDCCFTWTPSPKSGVPRTEQCSCLSDPQTKGLSTCEEVAARGGGKVVALCPAYAPNLGGFPTPDGGL
jgi:hypothetical protein